MTKFTFTNPKSIGKNEKAMAIFCLCTSYQTLSKGYILYEFGEYIAAVLSAEVKSIEHVKPTDL